MCTVPYRIVCLMMLREVREASDGCLKQCVACAAFERATSNISAINGVIYNEIIETVFMTKRSLSEDVLPWKKTRRGRRVGRGGRRGEGSGRGGLVYMCRRANLWIETLHDGVTSANMLTC